MLAKFQMTNDVIGALANEVDIDGKIGAGRGAGLGRRQRSRLEALDRSDAPAALGCAPATRVMGSHRGRTRERPHDPLLDRRPSSSHGPRDSTSGKASSFPRRYPTSSSFKQEVESLDRSRSHHRHPSVLPQSVEDLRPAGAAADRTGRGNARPPIDSPAHVVVGVRGRLARHPPRRDLRHHGAFRLRQVDAGALHVAA